MRDDSAVHDIQLKRETSPLSHVDRSADDGKRFVEVPSGTSCAERFMWQERDDIEKNRGRSRRGIGSGLRLRSRVGGFIKTLVFH